MREIKFRAWVVNGKAMADWKTITKECDRLSLLKDDNFIFMQFTGLTDKNGVEIYEGDIVSDHVGIGEVKYSDKHAAFRVVYGDGMAKWFHDYNLKGERESIEIIGNLHQNPELLEQ